MRRAAIIDTIELLIPSTSPTGGACDTLRNGVSPEHPDPIDAALIDKASVLSEALRDGTSGLTEVSESAFSHSCNRTAVLHQSGTLDRNQQLDLRLDQALRDSFPASDPIAIISDYFSDPPLSTNRQDKLA